MEVKTRNGESHQDVNRADNTSETYDERSMMCFSSEEDEDRPRTLNESEKRALRVWNRARPASKAVEIYEKQLSGRREEFLANRRLSSMRMAGIVSAVGVALILTGMGFAGNEVGGLTGKPGGDDTKGYFLQCNDNEKCLATKEKALSVAKLIEANLSSHSGFFLCGLHGYQHESVSLDQVRTLVFEAHQDKKWSEKDLTNAMDLFIENPNWSVRLLNRKGVYLTGSAEDTVHRLLSLNPQRTPLCRLLSIVSDCKQEIAIICLSCLVFAFISLLYMKYTVQAAKAMLVLVDVVLRHLHDRYLMSKSSKAKISLTKISDTKEKLKETKRLPFGLWEEAVEWIRFNESCIKIQSLDEKLHWQWVDINKNHSLESSDEDEHVEESNTKIVWQGKAIDHYPPHDVWRLSIKKVRPTVCIKLRNAFNPQQQVLSHSLVLKLENAFLEKCSHLGGIMHLHVSKQSKEGSVYMKCHSLEDACHIRNALHGMWFNGKLLTATYVQVSRYHDRFPEAKKISKLLFPTT
eukprot:m.93115 g.93115  ORF g.93115 m.93115 type:complete len:520 (+) comp36770_c0_seq7:51-1610(+)